MSRITPFTVPHCLIALADVCRDLAPSAHTPIRQSSYRTRDDLGYSLTPEVRLRTHLYAQL